MLLHCNNKRINSKISYCWKKAADSWQPLVGLLRTRSASAWTRAICRCSGTRSEAAKTKRGRRHSDANFRNEQSGSSSGQRHDLRPASGTDRESEDLRRPRKYRRWHGDLSGLRSQHHPPLGLRSQNWPFFFCLRPKREQFHDFILRRLWNVIRSRIVLTKLRFASKCPCCCGLGCISKNTSLFKCCSFYLLMNPLNIFLANRFNGDCLTLVNIGISGASFHLTLSMTLKIQEYILVKS